MKRIPLFTGILVALAFVGAASAQNPCNPCGGKKHANPCGMKAHAINPCHAKMGTVFHIADPMNRNVVSFESDAPLEDIVGTSNMVQGYVVFDPNKPKGGVRGELMVPVTSLDTGIPLRDEHLQSAMWLNAKAHPHITMHINGASKVKKVKSTGDFATYSMTVQGEFSVNGKSQKVKIPVKVTFLKQSEQTKQLLPGDLLAGRGEFEVSLSDHGVKGMEGVVGSKVNDTINVKVSFTASSEAPEMAMNPCGGKAAK